MLTGIGFPPTPSSFPRKRESTPGPIATPKATGALDSGAYAGMMAG